MVALAIIELHSLGPDTDNRFDCDALLTVSTAAYCLLRKGFQFG
jgi:hypothetical protein